MFPQKIVIVLNYWIEWQYLKENKDHSDINIDVMCSIAFVLRLHDHWRRYEINEKRIPNKNAWFFCSMQKLEILFFLLVSVEELFVWFRSSATQ